LHSLLAVPWRAGALAPDVEAGTRREHDNEAGYGGTLHLTSFRLRNSLTQLNVLRTKCFGGSDAPW
jgi:hypothetical protein